MSVERPWPPTGLTSATWQHIPPTPVRLDDLILTQDGIYLDALIDFPAPVGGDPFPHAVRYRGRLYLEDGHTRWARHKLLGGRWMAVRIHDAG